MARKKFKSSQKPVEVLLERKGREFTPAPQKLLGASDSAHAAVIGKLDGKDVVIKPFRSKGGMLKAQVEEKITNEALVRGIRTPSPLEVINLKQQGVALYVSEYIPNLIGAHTLSYEVERRTYEEFALSSAVRAQVRALGNLHGKNITHGDAQLKNIHFSSAEVFNADSALSPYLLDFENGQLHEGLRSSVKDYESGVIGDLSRFAVSLGARQYGGLDSELAQEVFRDNVVARYLTSPGGQSIGRMATSTLIDSSVDSFKQGRNNKAPNPIRFNLMQKAA